eukprot:97502-Ditylum_brightwellii.AAC.1
MGGTKRRRRVIPDNTLIGSDDDYEETKFKPSPFEVDKDYEEEGRMESVYVPPLAGTNTNKSNLLISPALHLACSDGSGTGPSEEIVVVTEGAILPNKTSDFLLLQLQDEQDDHSDDFEEEQEEEPDIPMIKDNND